MNSKVKKILNNIYNSPAHPASFRTVNALWKAVNKSIPKSIVEQWLQTQNAYTLHKPLRKRFKRNRYWVHYMDDLWQADLNDMKSIQKHNNGFIYLLTVVDCFSKFAWAVPLRRKTGTEVSKAFAKIFKESKRIPVKLQTDKGKEFINKKFQTFLKEHNVKYYHTNNPDIKASIVERYNRTLKTRMWRYFTARNTRRYITVLPQLLKSYNNTVHSSIRMSPSEVNDRNELEVWHNLYGSTKGKFNTSPKLYVGNHVRISNEKLKFEKSYEQNWSDEIFIVTSVIKRKPIVYRIKDLNEEEIEGTFYEKELQKVEYSQSTEFIIDKIIDSKGTGVRKKVLVKWRGYPSKFNSWILASELKRQ